MRQSSCRFIGVIALLAAMVLSACGDNLSSSSLATMDASGQNLSTANDLALVAMQRDEYFLVDGGVADRGEALSSKIWHIDEDGQRVVAEPTVALRSPKAWRVDGHLIVIGMDCPTLEDAEERPTCAEAPLMAVEVGLDGKFRTWDLGVMTSGEVGFSAARFGTAGIALVVYHATALEARLWTVDGWEGQSRDHGVVDANRLCWSGDRTVLYPGDISNEGSHVLYEVTKEGPARIDEVAAFESDAISIEGCTGGKLLVGGIMEGGVKQYLLDIHDAQHLTEVTVPSEWSAGLLFSMNGQLFSWVAGEADNTWLLGMENQGTWSQVSSVKSLEPPEITVQGEATWAVLVYRDGLRMVEVIK